jgi:hypothetical protein
MNDFSKNHTWSKTVATQSRILEHSLISAMNIAKMLQTQLANCKQLLILINLKSHSSDLRIIINIILNY